MAFQQIGYGFSFDGIHCDDMHCELANNDEVMHRITDEFKIASTTVDGYDGAYYEGYTVGAMEIPVKLLVEDATIEDMNRIGQWLKAGKNGRLIFDHMPYKYYNVRVSSLSEVPVYMGYRRRETMWTYNGTISVKFTAFVPRSYLLDEVKEAYPEVGDMLNTLNAGSGIMTEDERPAVSGDGDLVVANVGTADAYPEIWLKGTFTNGVTVTNETTGQSFTLKDNLTGTHIYSVNSATGMTYSWPDDTDAPTNEAERTELYATVEHTLADKYRTGQFIKILPCYPMTRSAGYTNVGGTVTLDRITMPDMVGSYMRVDGDWYEITAANGYTLTLDGTPDDGDGMSHIMKLNKITVSVEDGDTLDDVTVYVKDTFY